MMLQSFKVLHNIKLPNPGEPKVADLEPKFAFKFSSPYS